MNWDDKSLNMLGLTDTEKTILNTVDTPKMVTEIVGQSGLSRTGVNYCLGNLISKGYIRTAKRGKRTVYTLANPNELRKSLFEAMDKIDPDGQTFKGARVIASGKGEFSIHVGTKEIIPAYERIAAKNKNERIRAIQHHRSWKELLKKVPPPKLVEFNKAITKNHIILDGILNESAYREYREEIKNDPNLNKATVESLGERIADYTVFPDKFFD